MQQLAGQGPRQRKQVQYEWNIPSVNRLSITNSLKFDQLKEAYNEPHHLIKCRDQSPNIWTWIEANFRTMYSEGRMDQNRKYLKGFYGIQTCYRYDIFPGKLIFMTY